MKVVLCLVAFAAVVVRCYEDDAARIAGWSVGEGVRTSKEGAYPFYVNILELDRKTLVLAGVLLKSRVVLTTAYQFVKAYREIDIMVIYRPDEAILTEGEARGRYYFHSPYKAEELVVQIGMHKRFEEEPSTQFFNIEEIVTHPGADENNYLGDFALKLSSEPELNKRVRTLGTKNLVTSTEEVRRFVKGRGKCVSMAYDVKHIRFYPLAMQEFTPHMRSRKYCDTLSPGTMNSRLLCSHNNSTTDNSNLCHGDGGAKLLCTVGEQTKLVGLGNGILSKYCEAGGSLFAGVAKYNDWIIKTTKLLQRDNED